MWTSVAVVILSVALVYGQTPDLVVPTDPRCSLPNMRIRYGFGYLRDINRCDAWIRCSFLSKTSIKSERQLCGCGKFWNDDVMTCVPALEHICQDDPCLPASTTRYAYIGNCRSYWMCDGSRTARGGCCDSGERFNAVTQTCDIDISCTDWCNCYDATTTDTPPCEFTPVSSDPNKYYVHDNGRTFMMACARGTNFNATRCMCSDRVETPQSSCTLDFDMRCNSANVRDVQNRVYIANTNVLIDISQQECIFDGTSDLLVNRFGNMDWRYNWAVRVAFHPKGERNDPGPLWANSCCANASPSIRLRLIREAITDAPRLEAEITTTNGQESVSVAYAPNKKNIAYMSYNGAKLSLCVKYDNIIMDSADVIIDGKTRRVHCSVGYGKDENNEHFTGVIYESQVFIFCVPKNFCGS